MFLPRRLRVCDAHSALNTEHGAKPRPLVIFREFQSPFSLLQRAGEALQHWEMQCRERTETRNKQTSEKGFQERQPTRTQPIADRRASSRVDALCGRSSFDQFMHNSNPIGIRACNTSTDRDSWVRTHVDKSVYSDQTRLTVESSRVARKQSFSKNNSWRVFSLTTNQLTISLRRKIRAYRWNKLHHLCNMLLNVLQFFRWFNCCLCMSTWLGITLWYDWEIDIERV